MATLLKNGIVIVHDDQDIARGIRADLLIEGDRIARIEPNLSVASDVKVVIDCTDKIIAPGFIDTHRHMYNIALRGRHGNDTLVDYLVKGKIQVLIGHLIRFLTWNKPRHITRRDIRRERHLLGSIGWLPGMSA